MPKCYYLSYLKLLAIEAWQEEVQQLIAEYAWRYDHPGEAIYAPLLLKQLSDAKPGK